MNEEVTRVSQNFGVLTIGFSSCAIGGRSADGAIIEQIRVCLTVYSVSFQLRTSRSAQNDADQLRARRTAQDDAIQLKTVQKIALSEDNTENNSELKNSFWFRSYKISDQSVKSSVFSSAKNNSDSFWIRSQEKFTQLRAHKRSNHIYKEQLRAYRIRFRLKDLKSN
ncbi:hypothetical protein F511_11576 [Dorcoceras hygrometricum]|uniref:Uncharacterized protein n=1 Tax=Dorcoceras hygrometricum TaxID=472368 RepID=A0A2Z7D1N6_9LAMI|nr:hypothetical protein F511_11576 [Dorcoceras hygrometricum]